MVFVLGTFNFMLQRLVINFALVCMVSSPAVSKSDANSNYSQHWGGLNSSEIHLNEQNNTLAGTSSMRSWELCQYHAMTFVDNSGNGTNVLVTEVYI